MRKILYIVMIITVAYAIMPFVNAQEKRKSLAVLEFQSSGGLGANEVTTLTNRFRGILVNTDKFDVVEREKMNDILKQQNMNLSDNCNSAECAVQVGQLLGVEEMIAGDIGTIGQTWTIDLRLIDVETGKILQTKSDDYKGEIDGLLNIMRSIASSFAGTKIEEAKTLENTLSGFADIYIVSTPSQSEIYLDGKKTNWITPFLIENIPIGKHLIEARYGEYIGRKEIELIKGTMENVNLKLTLPTRPVKIVSDPLEAVIFIDDQEKGKTPIILDIEAGEHTVRFSKPGYTDQTKSFIIKASESSNTVLGELVRITKLNVNVFVPIQADAGEVQVYIDGIRIGIPPVSREVAAGSHVIRVTNNGSVLAEYYQNITLEGEETINVRLPYRDSFLKKNQDLKKRAEKDQIDYTPYVWKGKR